MSRYSRINIAKNDNEDISNVGAQYYISNFYPTIPLNSNDIYVITEFSDRLDILANRFYGDSNLYWIIASANPDVVRSDSLSLAGGIQLRIPTDVNSILTNYNILNSIGTSVDTSSPEIGNAPAGSSRFSSTSIGGGRRGY